MTSGRTLGDVEASFEELGINVVDGNVKRKSH